MKRSVILLLLITAIVLTFGVRSYNGKLEKNQAKAEQDAAYQAKLDKKTAEENAIKLEKEKEAKIAEQKEVFNKHNGETLTYIPMGDSLAAGYASYDSDHRYVSLLKNLLHEKMGYNVIIPKEIVASGKGLKDEGIPNESIIQQYKPDLVTIEFGTNDADINKKDAYADTNTFFSELNSFVKYIHSVSPSTKIILVTTWKSGGFSFKYDNIIENVGTKNNIPTANIEDIWSRSDTVDKKGTPLKNGVSDGWHPNNLGHQLIAEAIYEQAFQELK